MLNPNIWRSQQLDFRWQGHQISYHDQGDGPVLLLLHGLPGNSWDWHMIWPMLCGQFRLITLDFLGCGDSDKPQQHDYRLADQAALVLSLLRYLNVSHYQLIGHGYGAAVSWALLNAEHTLQPSAISWLAPRLCGDRDAYLWRERWLSGPSGHLLSPLVSEGLYGRYLEKLTGPYAPLTTQRLRDSWQLLCAHQGLHVLPRMFNYRYELPLCREWDSLAEQLPSLQVISGHYDPLARALPALAGKRHVQLQTGHYPQLEDPGNLVSALLEFHCSGPSSAGAGFDNLRQPS